MEVKVSYQTIHLPPPFAYAYTLNLLLENEEVHVDFEQEYLNRDSISEEEILEEGFSTDDDFKWKGTLGKQWFGYLNSLFGHVNLREENPDAATWIHINIVGIKHGVASDTDFWEYELQELIQAVFEQSGRENQLMVYLTHIVKIQKHDYTLIGKFSEREALINERVIDWKAFRSLLHSLFSLDFDESEEISTPREEGLWVRYDQEPSFYPVSGGKNQQEILSCLTAFQ